MKKTIMEKTILVSKEELHRGNLVLVNARHPFADDITDDLVSVQPRFPDVFLRRDSANLLQLLLEKIHAGSSIALVSGWRSTEEQTQLYQRTLEEKGEDFTRQFVARPRCSEHETGLAVDLALEQDEIDLICPEFPYDGICSLFRELAPDYGLIQRYEKGKEQTTGISHEPWHFRYVGYPHSRIMAENGLSLEEYIDFIKDYRQENRLDFETSDKGRMQIYYVPTQGEETKITFAQSELFQISGNNVDGFIVTIWEA